MQCDDSGTNSSKQWMGNNELLPIIAEKKETLKNIQTRRILDVYFLIWRLISLKVFLHIYFALYVKKSYIYKL